ncbi:uncharacterized protein ACIBXB_002372 [Morphnus guianensis]
MPRECSSSTSKAPGGQRAWGAKSLEGGNGARWLHPWEGGRGDVKAMAEREGGRVGAGGGCRGCVSVGQLWDVKRPLWFAEMFVFCSWCPWGDLASPASTACVGSVDARSPAFPSRVPGGGTPIPPGLLPTTVRGQHLLVRGTWAGGAAPGSPSFQRCSWQLVTVDLSSSRSLQSLCFPQHPPPQPCSPPWVPSAGGPTGAAHPTGVLMLRVLPHSSTCKPTSRRDAADAPAHAPCLGFPPGEPGLPAPPEERVLGGGSRAGEQDRTCSSPLLPPRCPNAQHRNEAEPVLCTHVDAASTQL